MPEVKIPVLDSKVGLATGRPEWLEMVNPDTNWSVVQHREVEGKPVYRVAAFNPKLGKNGVSMSIIEKPEMFEEKADLDTLNTLEIKFDDYDPVTKQDAYAVGLINLEEATGFTQAQLTEIFTNPENLEEFAEKYVRKFQSLHELDVASLFRDPEGIEQMVNLVFRDLVENVEASHEETVERIRQMFSDRDKQK